MPTTPPVPDPAPDLQASPTAAVRVRRAFSLSGVVPLGAFLVVHLAMNLRALAGGRAFTAAVRALHDVPALPLVEALFVFAPLVFHGALGLWLVLARRPLAVPSPYPLALARAMRATGIVVLVFLALHLSELRFHTRGFRLGGRELASLLDADLSATSHGIPWRGIAYLVGTACVVFHFAAGLWGFFARTPAGRDSGRRRKQAAWGAAGLGLAMWVSFADVVVLRATGATWLGGAPGDPPSSAPCPVSDGPP